MSLKLSIEDIALKNDTIRLLLLLEGLSVGIYSTDCAAIFYISTTSIYSLKYPAPLILKIENKLFIS